MLKIFISYSTRDYKLALAIVKYLETKGIYAYIAERDIQVGKPLSNKIIKNIEICDYFLVLYTSSGKESSFVNQEIGYWIKAHGFTNFIPLVEKGINPEGFLTGLEYIAVNMNQIINLSNNFQFLDQIGEEKEIESICNKILLGLGILGLGVLIIYGIYRIIKI